MIVDVRNAQSAREDDSLSPLVVELRSICGPLAFSGWVGMVLGAFLVAIGRGLEEDILMDIGLYIVGAGIAIFAIGALMAGVLVLKYGGYGYDNY